MAPIRQPLENAGMNEVCIRVAYQLVVIAYRQSPDSWRAYPANCILDLAEHLRAHGFGNLHWTLNGCARWVGQGCSLAEWRTEAATVRGVRAFHKRARPGRR